MKVRFQKVDARSVFNLTSPRYLPHLSHNWRGRRPWWHPHYEPVRNLCERVYIQEFDRRTGHYSLLEESVRREGIRNPVMLSAGKLLRRRRCELPPDWETGLVSEYVGGSRLMVAAKLGIPVPAIINDFREGESEGVIAPGDTKSLLSHFADVPQRVRWEEDGSVYINYLPFVHYPENRRLTLRAQSKVRDEVIRIVLFRVKRWMAKYD